MKKRKQIALNKLFNVCVILGLFIAVLSIEFFAIRTSHGDGD
jgi:hypothetical protein